MTRTAALTLCLAALAGCQPPGPADTRRLENYEDRLPDSRLDFPRRAPHGGDLFYDGR